MPKIQPNLRLHPSEGGGESHHFHFLAKIFVAAGGPLGPWEFCCGLWKMVKKFYPSPILVLKKPCLTALAEVELEPREVQGVHVSAVVGPSSSSSSSSTNYLAFGSHLTSSCSSSVIGPPRRLSSSEGRRSHLPCTSHLPVHGSQRRQCRDGPSGPLIGRHPYSE